MHSLPAEMYPICIQAYLYMYNQTKNKFHCFLSPRTSSLKKWYQFLQTPSHRQSAEYGMALVLQVHVSHEQKFLNLQFFNSLHGFEAFSNVVHSGLTSHPQSVMAMDCSFNGVLFDQIQLCSIALKICCSRASFVEGIGQQCNSTWRANASDKHLPVYGDMKHHPWGQQNTL